MFTHAYGNRSGVRWLPSGLKVNSPGIAAPPPAARPHLQKLPRTLGKGRGRPRFLKPLKPLFPGDPLCDISPVAY